MIDENETPAIDLMIEFALEEILSGQLSRRKSLVRRMAQQWPEMPALSMSYALTRAAGILEEQFGTNRDPSIGLAWQLSALVAADIHAMNAAHSASIKAEELAHFWRRAEPSFLRVV